MDRRAFLASASCAVLVGCDEPDPAVKREKTVAARSKEVVVGVAWSWTPTTDKFREGVELAAEEINQAGGVLGLPLRLVFRDDKRELATARIEAQHFVDDPDIVAVVGHRHADISEVVAPVYERAGLLYVTPGVASPKLTEQGYRHVFTTLPDVSDFGYRMAVYAADMGFANVLVFYARNELGRVFANSFELEAEDRGVHVIDRLSYDRAAGLDFKATLMEWRKYYFADALFVVGSQPHVSQIVKQARDVGLDLPIFGSPGLVSEALLEAAGEAAQGVVSPGVVHLEESTGEMGDFAARFLAHYDEAPDVWAAQGYEAVKLLAGAIEESGAMEPEAIAETLRRAEGWTGLSGRYTFDKEGNLMGKRIYLIRVEDGQIVSF